MSPFEHPWSGRLTDAPWPYPDPPVIAPTGPTWACPDGTCVCHAPADVELDTYHISFFDEGARRIPHARCRVLLGRTLLDHDDWADALAVVAVRVPRHAKHVTVEWAPPTLPTGRRYPFRVRYVLCPARVEREQGIAERLAHLGFTAFPTLVENTRSFQRHYGQPVTDDPLDIGPLLQLFHDGGALPPLVPHGTELRLLDDGRSAEQPSAQPVPTPLPQHGCVAGIATQSLAIGVHTLFSLATADITPDELHFRGRSATVSAAKLLAEYYRGPQRQRQWHPRGETRVAQGTIRLTIGNQFVEAPISPSHDFVVCIPAAAGATARTVRVEVSPAAPMLNSTGRPAGPDLTDGNTTTDFLFRPFGFTFTVDDTGAVSSDPVLVTTSTPRFVSFRLDTTTAPPRIEIDWRPDWMRAGQLGTTPPGNLPKARVPREVPVNPFDPATPADAVRALGKPVIVLHNTSTQSLSTLTSYIQEEQPGLPTARRAAREAFPHYQIDLDGHVVKLCDEVFRAAHAGRRSAWEDRRHVNDFSVGIEVLHNDAAGTPPAGMQGQPFTLEQYAALDRLLGELRATYHVAKYRIIGHHQELLMSLGAGQDEALSTERRQCPGSNFDWARFEPDHTLKPAATAMSETPARPITRHFHAVDTNTESFQRWQHGLVIGVAKTLLFDLGYWVSPTLVAREQLDDQFDDAFAHAVRAFQARRFAGRSRHYTIATDVGRGGAGASGTLDPQTLKMLLRVWTARFE